MPRAPDGTRAADSPEAIAEGVSALSISEQVELLELLAVTILRRLDPDRRAELIDDLNFAIGRVVAESSPASP